MANKNNEIIGASGRKHAVWLGLLSIAWLQLAFAVHQFDHAADYVGDTCQVCVQLDRVDEGAVDLSMPAEGSRAAVGEALPTFARPYSLGIVRGFQSRAPPFI